MTDYPHVPAAFINAIAEEGTKAEAIEYLQKQWNENCALREQLRKFDMTAVIEECALTAIKHGDLLEIHSPRIADAIRSLKDKFALTDAVIGIVRPLTRPVSEQDFDMTEGSYRDALLHIKMLAEQSGLREQQHQFVVTTLDEIAAMALTALTRPKPQAIEDADGSAA